MSILNLPPEMICYILGFLSVKDHSRFSLTCRDYYEAFGITKIECREDVRKYDDFVSCYMVLRSYSNDGGVLRGVVGLDVVEYAGTTRYVKDLTIRAHYKYIHGDTIQYIPKSLGGEGLKYLVKLDIERCPYKCTISDVRFERLISLRAHYCSIIRCKFAVLEDLNLLWSQFLSEMPATIKILRVSRSQFLDNCVKVPLVNLLEIYSTAHDFIQYAPNVKKVVFCNGELHGLPKSLEYLRLVDVEVYGEKFYLPNLRYLCLKRSRVGHIIAPRLSELTLKCATIPALDGPVLDKCHIRKSSHNISIQGATELNLEGDCSLDSKCFNPKTVQNLRLANWPGDINPFKGVRKLTLTNMQYNEQLHLPHVEELNITMCRIGTLVAKNAKEVYLICGRIDRLVLDRAMLSTHLAIIGALEARSIHTLSVPKPAIIHQCGNLYETVEVLYANSVVDRKSFPRLRALYYSSDNVEDGVGDMLSDLDALYVKRFTSEMTSYINPRILVVKECGPSLNLSNLSNLKLLMLSRKDIQVIPEETPIEYFEKMTFPDFVRVCNRPM